MKRINLTHGTARVDENISNETLKALNKLSELAFNHAFNKSNLSNNKNHE